MAWYPEAVRKQLTVPNRAKPSGRIAMPSPVRVNLHTAVSNSYSLAWDETTGRQGYFNTTGAGGVFSHFYVRKDGTVEQMQDTAYRSSCDLDGNPDTISVETWDGYKTGFPGYWSNDSDAPPWNAAQVASLIKLVRWIHATHPSIPRKIATSNLRGYASQGLSWHRLGVPGYSMYTAANGGLMYTNSYKKGCPGNRRISQIPEIHRLATSGAALPDTAPDSSLEDDMPLTDADILKLLTTKINASGTTVGVALEAAARAASLPTATDTTDALLGRLLGSSGPTVAVALQDTFYSVQALRRLTGVEVDVDETAMAQQVAAIVAPVVRDAVVAAATAGGTPEAVADAVVAKLGAALQD